MCVHKSVCVESALGECLQVGAENDTREKGGGINVWNVDNAGATFVICHARWAQFPNAISRTLSRVMPHGDQNLFSNLSIQACQQVPPAWALSIGWRYLSELQVRI